MPVLESNNFQISCFLLIKSCVLQFFMRNQCIFCWDYLKLPIRQTKKLVFFVHLKKQVQLELNHAGLRGARSVSDRSKSCRAAYSPAQGM